MRPSKNKKISTDELVAGICARTGATQEAARDFIKVFASETAFWLSRGNAVRVPELGTFHVKRRKETVRRTPSLKDGTPGSLITVPSKLYVKLNVSEPFEERVTKHAVGPTLE